MSANLQLILGAIARLPAADPPQKGVPGGACDKCVKPETCARLKHCLGYHRKFGTWEKP